MRRCTMALRWGLFVLALASACAAPLRAEAGQALRRVRFIAGAGTLDPILVNLTVGQELGFYREEGLDVDFAAAAGTGGSLGMVATGAAEFAVSTAPPLLQAAARGQDMGLVTIYTWTRDIHWQVAVKPESPVRELRDLKGRKIGVQSFGDSAYPGGRAMLREVGVDPDRDATFIAVGLGATAASALMNGQVDALSIWDGAFAAIENLGFKLRYLPLTPTANELFGSGVAVRRDFLAQNRALVAGAMRAMTKGAIFVLENPEAAARVHWKLFPEAKPKGKGEAEALRETVRVIRSRSGKYALDPVKMPKYGWNYPKGWEAYVTILALNPAAVGDLHRFYTNDLIDEANQVDAEKVRALARNYKP
jgi:NitT/TauT family transport system substrate-binding protein